MDAFRTEFTKDLLAAVPASVQPNDRKTWYQSLAAWLYKGNQRRVLQQDVLTLVQDATKRVREIGRASCRERV